MIVNWLSLALNCKFKQDSLFKKNNKGINKIKNKFKPD